MDKKYSTVAFRIAASDVLTCGLLKSEWYFSNSSSSSLCQMQGSVSHRAAFCSQHTSHFKLHNSSKDVFSTYKSMKAIEWKVDYTISSFIRRIWILNFHIAEGLRNHSYADVLLLEQPVEVMQIILVYFAIRQLLAVCCRWKRCWELWTDSLFKLIREVTAQRSVFLSSLLPVMPTLSCWEAELFTHP